MKNAICSVTFILFSSLACAAVDKEAYDLLEEFHSARTEWAAAMVEAKQTKDLKGLDAALDNMQSAWASVPAELQKARYDEWNRTWFEMAELSANFGDYDRALDYINKEVLYQYSRDNKVFLSGQNRPFFQTVVCLEAKILGHLGRKKYFSAIDCYLMPVDAAGTGTDYFVALESTAEDQERGISIPPLPKDTARKILYLLAPTANGDYVVKDSVQMIGKAKGTRVVLNERGGAPTVTLEGVTHTVELNDDGIPVKYDPLAVPLVRLAVTAEGFREASPSAVQ